MSEPERLTIYLVAGEPSGDQLGAHLMGALTRLSPLPVRFLGIGGERMGAEGLVTLFPMSELALMGLEIVPRLRRLLRRIGEATAHIRATEPDVLVTIDAQGFSKRIGLALKDAPFPIVQYVAPTVWAWKPWRARTVATYLAHMLAIFPFEARYFERHGLATTFVGHPAAENAERRGDRAAFRAHYGIASTAPVLCCLPGSRPGEVARHLPIFRATLARLAAVHEGLHVLVPTVPTVADAVGAAARTWSVPAIVLRAPLDKYDAFAAADAALAASGTVTSETAFAELPTVVMYRINPVAARIAHWLLKSREINFASAVNIVGGREIMPEFIQYTCTPENLAAAVSRLLRDRDARQAQIAALREVTARLAVGGAKPSEVAARKILEIVVQSHSARSGKGAKTP